MRELAVCVVIVVFTAAAAVAVLVRRREKGRDWGLEATTFGGVRCYFEGSAERHFFFFKGMWRRSDRIGDLAVCSS